MPLILIALLLLTGCAEVEPPVVAWVGYTTHDPLFGEIHPTMECNIFKETETVVRCNESLFKRSEVIILRAEK